MKIAIASDHAGFELKNKLVEVLKSEGHDVVDCGPENFDPNDDYPDFIGKAAEMVSNDNSMIGIVLGKSGAGEAIVANKFSGIRAVLAVNDENVRLSREHNDANMLSIGTVLTNDETAINLVKIFLNTPFSKEERHVRRIEKIKEIENGQH